MATPEEVTRLLFNWRNGDRAAIDALTPIVYTELRRLASVYLRNESAAPTLQPTALVHEAYIRLASQKLPDFESRSHFFAIAAQLMRQVLVDHARKFRSAKRGGGMPKASFEDALAITPERSLSILALDDALNGLEKLNARQAKVIELRFFGGLSVEETAQALNISTATVGREQRVAEAWLHREMNRSASA